MHPRMIVPAHRQRATAAAKPTRIRKPRAAKAASSAPRKALVDQLKDRGR